MQDQAVIFDARDMRIVLLRCGQTCAFCHHHLPPIKQALDEVIQAASVTSLHMCNEGRMEPADADAVIPCH